MSILKMYINSLKLYTMLQRVKFRVEYSDEITGTIVDVK